MDIDIQAEIKKNEELVAEYQNAISKLKLRLEETKSANKDIGAVANEFPVSPTKSESSFVALAGPSERSIVKKKSASTSKALNKMRSELPSVGLHCEFEWKNINVHVGSGSDTKQILHDMNGSIQSGQLMAIMGGSGAGKSTLLNVLSGRTNLNAQRVTGAVTINGKELRGSAQPTIKSLCSFVPQSDILCSTQTVYEALLFYAKLKLSHKIKRRQIKRINYLIKVLHLESCKDNMIGSMNESSARKGISGGERRRVCIASEVVNDVDIIFLDEPTSGLDSFTAAATIKTLKEFCTVSNKIIIATIHQPSMEVFYLFDKLVLLSHGKCCFSGDMKTMEIFFKDSMRPKTNPADTILFEIQKEADKYAKKWKESALNPINEMQGSMMRNPTYREEDAKQASNNLDNAALYIQISLLLQREFQSLYRDKKVSFIRIAQVIFFAAITGLIYFDIKEDFQRRSESFFFLSFIPMLIGMVSLLVVFPQQKALFQREYNSNTYSIFSFAASFTLIELPRELIHMAIFNAIALAMVGLDGDWLYYLATLCLCTLSGGSFGMFFGVISNSSTEAAQMIPASLIPLIMFSDFIIAIDTMPEFIQWVADVNPLYYLFRCFMIIEFEDAAYDPRGSQVENCEAHILAAQWRASQNATLPALDSIPGATSSGLAYDNSTDADVYDIPMTTLDQSGSALDVCREDILGTTILEDKGIDPSELYWNFLWIFVICVVVRLLSIFLLYMNLNNGWSWLRKKIKDNLLCCCYRKTKKQDETEQNMSDNIEIGMMQLAVNSVSPDLFTGTADENPLGLEYKDGSVPNTIEEDDNESEHSEIGIISHADTVNSTAF